MLFLLQTPGLGALELDALEVALDRLVLDQATPAEDSDVGSRVVGEIDGLPRLPVGDALVGEVDGLDVVVTVVGAPEGLSVTRSVSNPVVGLAGQWLCGRRRRQ